MNGRARQAHVSLKKNEVAPARPRGVPLAILAAQNTLKMNYSANNFSAILIIGSFCDISEIPENRTNGGAAPINCCAKSFMLSSNIALAPSRNKKTRTRKALRRDEILCPKTFRLSHRLPAVHIQSNTGNERGIVGSQKSHDAGDVICIGMSAQRYLRYDALTLLGAAALCP